MKQTKFVRKLLSAGVLSLAFGTIGVQVARAQRAIPLLDIECIRTSGSNDRIYDNTKSISVNKQFETAIMYMSDEAAYTCKLPPARSAFLRLEYAIPDTGRGQIQMDIYLDGNLVDSGVATAGKTGTLLVDLTNGRSLAIENSCISSSCGYVYFFKAEIEVVTSPGGRQ